MENKINIAELLKDCPLGMELYSPLCGKCRFIKIYNGLGFDVINDTNDVFNFSYDGRYTLNGECCIFPSKENRNWSTFQRPFKDGDIVYIKTKYHNHNEFIIIFKEIKNDHIHKHVCFAYQILSTSKAAVCHIVDAEIMRLATEEEKQKLFDAIKANGYHWNDETKTLEKLIIPNKFDITTLKPFDKVLVRDTDTRVWVISFYGFGDEFSTYKYSCTDDHRYMQCIPYEGNEHLLGTADDCDEFYKTWE